MTEKRHLQVHTLTSYPSALLNRDDSGLAKRVPYGGAMRTRISSQCLKRHWRMADDPRSLRRIDGVPVGERSRETVTKLVAPPLRDEHPDDVVEAIETVMQTAVYGDKGGAKASRQALLLGEPEIDWLRNAAGRLAARADGDAEKAKEAADEWRREVGAGLKAMRQSAALPGGIESALFGRMVTSDPAANITAPVHVAHALTVHAEESESDFLISVDDLAEEGEPSVDTLQEAEIASGLYYGYVAVDLLGLLGNLGGDARLAGEILHNLIYLIAEVSPGAKLGSTAPYSRASYMLLEAGDRQPRSLAGAYETPCVGRVRTAIDQLARHLSALDQAYATGEERRVMSLVEQETPSAKNGSIADLAAWAQDIPGTLAS